MEANDGRLFAVVEVTGDGVAEHGFQLIESIGLRKNGMPQGASFISAFGRFLNREDDFALRHVGSQARLYAESARMAEGNEVRETDEVTGDEIEIGKWGVRLRWDWSN